MWRAGDVVGDLEIVAPLRGGGMAALLLARRVGASGFARHVAVKVIHDHLASDPDMVRLFIDEARLQARIRHPQVVHVEQLGTQEGRHFLVMEYVHGVSLSQLLTALRKRELRLSPALAVALAMEVLSGLHAAHEVRGDDGEPLGAVHRDVSPQNVLVSRDGHVKLIDFGIAKARDRLSQTTGQGLRGKIRYMSPEQAFGRPVDRRTDVYALGIVLWETLTLRRRFRAEGELAVLEEVRSATPEPAARWVRDLPPEVDAVLARAMASAPVERFATAQDMRRALGDALPEARAVEPEHLAAVVEHLLGMALDDQLAALPSSARSLWSGAPPRLELVEERELLRPLDHAATNEAEHGPTPSEVEVPRAAVPSTPPESRPESSGHGSNQAAVVGGLARPGRRVLVGGLTLVSFAALAVWLARSPEVDDLRAPDSIATEPRVDEPYEAELRDEAAPEASTPATPREQLEAEVEPTPDVRPNDLGRPAPMEPRGSRAASRSSTNRAQQSPVRPTPRQHQGETVPGTFTEEF